MYKCICTSPHLFSRCQGYAFIPPDSELHYFLQSDQHSQGKKKLGTFILGLKISLVICFAECSLGRYNFTYHCGHRVYHPVDMACLCEEASEVYRNVWTIEGIWGRSCWSFWLQKGVVHLTLQLFSFVDVSQSYHCWNILIFSMPTLTSVSLYHAIA